MQHRTDQAMLLAATGQDSAVQCECSACKLRALVQGDLPITLRPDNDLRLGVGILCQYHGRARALATLSQAQPLSSLLRLRVGH